MNKIYNLAWNEATRAWVAVSEHVSGQGKKTTTRSRVLQGQHKRSVGLGGLILLSVIAIPQMASAASYNDGFIQIKDGAYGKGEAVATSINTLAIGAGAQAAAISATSVGSSAKATGVNSTAVGTLSGAQSAESSAFGIVSKASGSGATAVGGRSNADGFRAVALGNYANASADNAVALGGSSSALHRDSVALGAYSSTSAAIGTAGISIAGAHYDFAGSSSKGVVSVGSSSFKRQLINLAAGRVGAGSTDAVNGSQLHATNLALEGMSAQVTQSGADMQNLTAKLNAGAVGLVNQDAQTQALAFAQSSGGSSVNFAGVDGDRTLSGVNAGTLAAGSTEAVNGSQLFEVAHRVDGLDGRVQTLESGLSAIASGDGVKYLRANSTGADAVASGTDSVALGASAQAVANDSVALGAGSVADRDNSVSVGSTDNARQITHVAGGSAATDAVNVAQLNEVRTSVGAVAGNLQNSDAAIDRLKNGQDGMINVNPGLARAAVVAPVASGVNAVAAGAGAVASGHNSSALGSSARATATNAVAVGNGASATAQNAVALGTDAVADRDNSVSLGQAGAERQMTHVAAGTSATDAVNLGQMSKGLAEANALTRQVYNTLHRDIKNLDDKLSAGVAGAMAMAALPQPYSPGASMTAAGVSGYRGQSALAVGMSHISDNGRWVSKLQGNTNTQGEVGLSVGVGYQW
ncbi:YadA-like family protein [Pseudomonas orientalis]|uniref:YadA-like family protein n=1 Tax=Pseudomonas orientalis TaxID=76758 RepID=UPI001FAEF242|nr:YadA-like family protein [Pseudomonas orientalis]MDF2793342.1 yadA 2 [Pseudomonas orientalis]UOB22186.1 YadA-like family protein [Pseudomonas orientalis]